MDPSSSDRQWPSVRPSVRLSVRPSHRLAGRRIRCRRTRTAPADGGRPVARSATPDAINCGRVDWSSGSSTAPRVTEPGAARPCRIGSGVVLGLRSRRQRRWWRRRAVPAMHNFRRTRSISLVWAPVGFPAVWLIPAVSVDVRPSVRLSSAGSSGRTFIRSPVHSSVRPSICPSIRLSSNPPMFVFVHPFDCPTVRPFVKSSVRPAVRSFVRQSVRRRSSVRLLDQQDHRFRIRLFRL